MNKLASILVSILIFTSSITANDARARLFQRAKKLYENGEYKKSRYLLNKLISWYQVEGNEEAYYLSAESLRKNKKFDKALKRYEEYLNNYTKKQNRSLYGKGQSLYHLNKMSDADKVFIELTKSDDRYHLNALIYLAAIAKEQGNAAKEKQYYQKASQLIDKKENQPGLSSLKAAIEEQLETGHGIVSQKAKKLKDFHFKSVQRLGLANGLPENTITDIAIDRNTVWIGTYNAGLYRYTPRRTSVERIQFPTNFIRNIDVLKNTIYIATYDGIFFSDRKGGRPKSIQVGSKKFSLAQSILVDHEDVYFSTLLHGVIKVSKEKKIRILNGKSYLRTRKIYSMASSKKYIAFGTVDNGCIVREKASKKTTYLSRRDGLQDINVKALAFQNDILWIATHYGGIYKYDLTLKRMELMQWEIPFPTTIVIDNGLLIIGSNGGGVYIIDPEERTMLNLSKKSGLLSNDVQIIKKELDKLWIGYLENGVEVLEIE